MSSNPVPYVSITQRSASQFTALRGIKVALLLVGLALCLVVMDSSPQWNALLALGDPIEPIVLCPTNRIAVQSEMVFPQMHMFNSLGFSKLTADKHVWAYMQTVEVEKHSGLVYFFKFKNESGACECVKTIQASQDFVVPHEGRQFDHYAILVIALCDSEDSSSFFETVFGQITRNVTG